MRVENGNGTKKKMRFRVMATVWEVVNEPERTEMDEESRHLFVMMRG
jgi:hypothetical protein